MTTDVASPTAEAARRLTLAGFLRLPESQPCHEFENGDWTAEGYVLTQTVGPGDAFAPRLFPELRIDLASLVDEAPPAAE
jgi:hypothetical protein